MKSDAEIDQMILQYLIRLIAANTKVVYQPLEEGWLELIKGEG